MSLLRRSTRTTTACSLLTATAPPLATAATLSMLPSASTATPAVPPPLPGITPPLSARGQQAARHGSDPLGRGRRNMAAAAGMAPSLRLPSTTRTRGQLSIAHPPLVPAAGLQVAQPVSGVSAGERQELPINASLGEDMDVEPLNRAPRLLGLRSAKGPMQGLEACNPPLSRGKMSTATCFGGVAQLPPVKAAKGRAAGGPTRCKEEQLWASGYSRVAGVDEAGRGPLAGPVVAAACVIAAGVHIPIIGDSKQLSSAQREAVYEALVAHPDVDYATCIVSAKAVDEINILEAAMVAMSDAVHALPGGADFVIVDGNRLPAELDHSTAEAIIKGDAKCYAIAAASIIAKVTRDRIMGEAHITWPQYGFSQHKGYGTLAHVAALRQHGSSPIHRRTFAPLRTWLSAEEAVGNAVSADTSTCHRVQDSDTA